MNVQYLIDLSHTEREQLEVLHGGRAAPVRRLKRANIPLMSERGQAAAEIEAAGHGSISTVYGTRERFVALADIESISPTTLGRRRHEKDTKPLQEKMWCIPEVDADFAAHIEDVREHYAEPPDPARPAVCIDETLKQLVEDVRTPLPPRPGSTGKHDDPCRPSGTANLFIKVDRHAKWRHVKVTGRKTNIDFAERMRDLLDVHHPEAGRIRVVLDHLSTHKAAALYEAFTPQEARRMPRRIESHHTPKHASGLDMAEIGNLTKQCLDRRIGDTDTLRTEVAAWEERRNREAQRFIGSSPRKTRARTLRAPTRRATCHDPCVEVPAGWRQAAFTPEGPGGAGRRGTRSRARPTR